MSHADRDLSSRTDDGVLLDAEDDDWAWRRKLRANPATARLYRLAVGITGALVVLGGLALVPLPGPGWVIVFGGLAIWASEFEWAQRLRNWMVGHVRAWNEWMKKRPLWFQALAAVLTLLAVLAVFWVLFRISGVPAFFPDGVEAFMDTRLGL